MKKLFTWLFLTISYFSEGQFEGKWYAFRIDDMSYNVLTKDKLIIGTIGNYNTPKQYLARVDTFTIKHRFLQNDSTLYIVTDKEPDNLRFDAREPKLHKFIYHKTANTISNFFYQTLAGFYEFQAKAKHLSEKDIRKFIATDTSGTAYLTYYSKDTIDAFMAYPKLIDQPADKIIALYNALTVVYASFNKKSNEEKMPYALLGGMAKSALEVPTYIALKICPLVKPENFDEIGIREKFSTNAALIAALDKFRRARATY